MIFTCSGFNCYFVICSFPVSVCQMSFCVMKLRVLDDWNIKPCQTMSKDKCDVYSSRLCKSTVDEIFITMAPSTIAYSLQNSNPL